MLPHWGSHTHNMGIDCESASAFMWHNNGVQCGLTGMCFLLQLWYGQSDISAEAGAVLCLDWGSAVSRLGQCCV